VLARRSLTASVGGNWVRWPLVVCVLLLSSGCASLHYTQVKQGELRGKLIVQWIDHDKFIFLPDKERPLAFTRYDRDTIAPGRMYTDGGSIPRPLWIFRSYSPWGYAPAFIVHDWLFHMKHCEIPGYEKYDVETAAWIMSEVMKTMMEREGKEAGDKLALYTMFEAVRSPIAGRLWNSGKCEEPPIELLKLKPKFEYVIEIP